MRQAPYYPRPNKSTIRVKPKEIILPSVLSSTTSSPFARNYLEKVSSMGFTSERKGLTDIMEKATCERTGLDCIKGEFTMPFFGSSFDISALPASPEKVFLRQPRS